MSDYESFDDNMENDEESGINENLLIELDRQAKGKQQEMNGHGFQDRPSMLEQDMPGRGPQGFVPGMPGGGGMSAQGSQNIDMLMDISLNVTVELGRTKMMLQEVLELQHGSVVELDRLAGDPVDIFVNNRLIARGEVVVVDDKFGVRITELISKTGKKGVV